MNSKKLISMIFLLLLLLVMPIQAFAMENVTAEISFTVKNAPGTVVMEAIDDAPLPEQTVFEKVTQGKFEITYTQPGDYYYKIYQKAGTQQNITYYSTVYMVRVITLVSEEDTMYPVVTVYIENSSQKTDNIEFENTLTNPSVPVEPTNPSKPTDANEHTTTNSPDKPYTGDESQLGLWIMLMALSLIGIITVSIIYKADSHERKEKS